VLPSEEDAQNLFLRHQLSIALRRAPPRLRLRGGDRAEARGVGVVGNARKNGWMVGETHPIYHIKEWH
jgi:hypothetical protein